MDSDHGWSWPFGLSYIFDMVTVFQVVRQNYANLYDFIDLFEQSVVVKVAIAGLIIDVEELAVLEV